jgi:hypothetical protein
MAEKFSTASTTAIVMLVVSFFLRSGAAHHVQFRRDDVPSSLPDTSIVFLAVKKGLRSDPPD